MCILQAASAWDGHQMLEEVTSDSRNLGLQNISIVPGDNQGAPLYDPYGYTAYCEERARCQNYITQLQAAAPDALSELSMTYSSGYHGDHYDSPGHQSFAGYHSDTDILHRFQGKHSTYKESPFHKSYSGYQATIGRLLNKSRDVCSIDINSIDSAHVNLSIGEEDLSCNSIISPQSGDATVIVTPPTPSTDIVQTVPIPGPNLYDITPLPPSTEDLPSVPPPSYESVVAERTVMIEVHTSQ